MSSDTTPLHIIFDPTPEIFATDTGGNFIYPLQHRSGGYLDTSSFDEARFVFSMWAPSSKKSIDLDRAYAEIRGSFDPEAEHWVKLAEIEPVVPPYGGGESFDGWIVLPVLGAKTHFALFGSGFEPRTRLQIRASVYLVT